jgi:hypothetical protein
MAANELVALRRSVTAQYKTFLYLVGTLASETRYNLDMS